MGDGASVGTKWVYSFGGGSSDGSAAMKNLLGGKGANLAAWIHPHHRRLHRLL